MPAGNADGVTLLYSYSHQDEALRGQLESHLANLKRSGVIQSWCDRNIGAGTDWSKEIDEHIEMKRALERDRAGEARVIPVILRAVDWAGAEILTPTSLAD